jgi:hypothetical protein
MNSGTTPPVPVPDSPARTVPGRAGHLTGHGLSSRPCLHWPGDRFKPPVGRRAFPSKRNRTSLPWHAELRQMLTPGVGRAAAPVPPHHLGAVRVRATRPPWRGSATRKDAARTAPNPFCRRPDSARSRQPNEGDRQGHHKVGTSNLPGAGHATPAWRAGGRRRGEVR